MIKNTILEEKDEVQKAKAIKKNNLQEDKQNENYQQKWNRN